MKPTPPQPPRLSPRDNPVIALSRYRAQLSRGRRLRRAEVLFSAAHPEQAIRALPGDEFFYVLQEVGFPEALELLSHATAEQVQTALDFGVWDRDIVAGERLEQWLEPISTLPFETIGHWFRAFDVELVALILRRRARIYDLSAGEPPDDPEGFFFPTPDGLFVLDCVGEEDEGRVTARIVDALYRYDREWMRRLLVGTIGDLDAELEETAFRWRSGRMADLGFEAFYDALEVYREIDPAKIQVGKPDQGRQPVEDSERSAEEPFLRVPTMLAERLTTGSPFGRAVAGITSATELADVHQALVLLCNRVLAADRVTPGDEPAVAKVLTRVAASLDLAVEFLARGSEETAVAAVRTVPLVRLHQLATTLIGKVRTLAVTLKRGVPFAKLHPDIDLLEAEDAEIIQALGALRPLYPCRLDAPPAPGAAPTPDAPPALGTAAPTPGAPPLSGERSFASLADLARATAAVERAGAALMLLHRLGLRAEHLVPAVLAARGITDLRALDTGSIARTLLIQHIIGPPPEGLAALAPEIVASFNQILRQPDVSARATAQIRKRAETILKEVTPSGPLGEAARAVAQRWVASLDPLGPVLTLNDAEPPGGPRR